MHKLRRNKSQTEFTLQDSPPHCGGDVGHRKQDVGGEQDLNVLLLRTSVKGGTGCRQRTSVPQQKNSPEYQSYFTFRDISSTILQFFPYNQWYSSLIYKLAISIKQGSHSWAEPYGSKRGNHLLAS